MSDRLHALCKNRMSCYKINHNHHHCSYMHQVVSHTYKNSNQDPSSKSSIISSNFVHRNLTPPLTNFMAPEHDNAYRIGYIVSAQISNTINEMNQHHHFCSLMHHVVSQIQNNNRIYYQNHRSFSSSLSTVISMHFTSI